MLEYLAPVDSPMIAHAKILKSRFPDCSVVFVGPCIAKKREAKESGVLAGALTFEELSALFQKHNISVEDNSVAKVANQSPNAVAHAAAVRKRRRASRPRTGKCAPSSIPFRAA